MTISEEERVHWHTAAARQSDYLTGLLVDAWGDPVSPDMRRILRQIATGHGVSTDDQKILADELRAHRTS